MKRVLCINTLEMWLMRAEGALLMPLLHNHLLKRRLEFD
jgi:hypothetical protein